MKLPKLVMAEGRWGVVAHLIITGLVRASPTAPKKPYHGKKKHFGKRQ